MVASAILMLTVTQSTAMFTQTIEATGQARLRDGLNAAINADLEQVRHQVSTWVLSSANDGQLAYAPPTQACADGTLAGALLAEQTSQLPPVSTIDLSGVPFGAETITVTRTIGTSPDNTNLLTVKYEATEGASTTTKLNTTLITPAQGWCP